VLLMPPWKIYIYITQFTQFQFFEQNLTFFLAEY